MSSVYQAAVGAEQEYEAPNPNEETPSRVARSSGSVDIVAAIGKSLDDRQL